MTKISRSLDLQRQRSAGRKTTKKTTAAGEKQTPFLRIPRASGGQEHAWMWRRNGYARILLRQSGTAQAFGDGTHAAVIGLNGHESMDNAVAWSVVSVGANLGPSTSAQSEQKTPNHVKTTGRRQDKTRQDKTRQDKTRQDKTRQDKTRQDKTRQDKTRQDKTRQDKTRQDKTRHDCL